jgi:hypothetical protein
MRCRNDPMFSLLKGMALFVAVTCVVWVAVLWNWETSNRNMTTGDIVVYLGVLPLFVFGVLLGLRWAWRTAEPRRAAAAASTAAATSSKAGPAGAPGTPPSGDDQQRYATIQLLAAHLACAAAASPADLLDAAKQNQPRPAPDAALRDAAGLPVICARIDGLDADALAPSLAPLADAARQRRPEWAGRTLGDHTLRALAALEEPLEEALRALQPWTIRLGAPDPDAALQAGTRRGGAQDAAPPSRLRLLLGWPEGWDEFEREVAAAWVDQAIRQHASEIPLAHVTTTAHTGSGEDLLLQAERLLQTMAREGRDDVVLVAACCSDLSDAAIALLEQQGMLFSATSRPKGVMAGEAAAALLLANPGWPADPAQLPSVRLQRPAVLRRDKPIDASGRTSSDCLLEATRQALAAARLEPAEVGALVCDADQHTARGTELFGTTIELLPQLDPGEDMRLIGTVTGHVGAVNALLVVAAAAHQARQLDKPCLALAQGDRHLRLALIARPPEPAPEPAPHPPAAPQAATR